MRVGRTMEEFITHVLELPIHSIESHTICDDMTSRAYHLLHDGHKGLCCDSRRAKYGGRGIKLPCFTSCLSYSINFYLDYFINISPEKSKVAGPFYLVL